MDIFFSQKMAFHPHPLPPTTAEPAGVLWHRGFDHVPGHLEQRRGCTGRRTWGSLPPRMWVRNHRIKHHRSLNNKGNIYCINIWHSRYIYIIYIYLDLPNDAKFLLFQKLLLFWGTCIFFCLRAFFGFGTFWGTGTSHHGVDKHLKRRNFPSKKRNFPPKKR